MSDDRLNPGKNYLRSVSDLKSFSAKVRRLPRLTIELTDRCNNNCQHCYINRPADDLQAIEREMETDFIKNLILQAANLGCFDLRFTGGEPLLRKDFSDLYLFSRKKGFDVIVSTNARLITPDLADLFKRLPPGQPIDITIYGMSSATYGRVSGIKGSFEEFRKGLDLLIQHNIDFVPRMAVLPDNRSDIPAYEEWIGKLFNGSRKPAYITNFYQRARHDNPDKNQRIRKLRSRPEDTVNLLARSDYYQGEIYDFCRQFTGLKSDRLFECGFGQSVSIDAYGNAQGCLLMRHPDMIYDLHSGKLSEALNTYFPGFLNLRATHPSFLKRCASCNLRGFCTQCPAQSWMEHGTLDTPVEFLCQVAHAHARKLGLLSEEENGWEITDWPSRLDQIKSDTLSNDK